MYFSQSCRSCAGNILYAHFENYVQDFVRSQSRPKATCMTRVIQGYETHKFKSNFESWPSGSVAPAEEGRGKVAGKVSLSVEIGIALDSP